MVVSKGERAHGVTLHVLFTLKLDESIASRFVGLDVVDDAHV